MHVGSAGIVGQRQSVSRGPAPSSIALSLQMPYNYALTDSTQTIALITAPVSFRRCPHDVTDESGNSNPINQGARDSDQSGLMDRDT